MNGVMMTVEDTRPSILIGRLGIAVYRHWPWFRRIKPMVATLTAQPIDLDVGPLDLSLAKTKLAIDAARKVARGEHVPAERLDMLSDLLMAPDERDGNGTTA